ncbi:hypothetical protein [Leptospira alexanderi]|uniref:hypothetical protein n=1 Tax=Leptospira alexanderi TaxID=100053 RepID=UPI002014B040|nr:hypothetical protein [Leptospira alexanderi]
MFVTFNRHTRPDESTALRLQTISNLFGVSVELPFRFEQRAITDETKRRIDRSNVVFCFSSAYPDEEVFAEIKCALENNKIVILLHNSNVQFCFAHVNLFKLGVDFSADLCSNILHQINKFLVSKFGSEYNRLSVLNALLGISVGMLTLSYFEDEEV